MEQIKIVDFNDSRWISSRTLHCLHILLVLYYLFNLVFTISPKYCDTF